MQVALSHLAPNCVRVRLTDRDLLFSYETPVAVWDYRGDTVACYSLRDAPSRTTAKHLGQHGPTDASPVSAEELEALLAS